MAELNDQSYLLIEQYIRGEMSSEQAALFEGKLAGDSDFAKAYKVEKDIHDSISYVEHQKLKGRLDRIHDDVFGSKGAIEKKMIPKRRWASLAAAMLVAVVVSLFFLLPQNQSAGQLMADFYEKPSFTQTRGISDSDDIQKAYRENNYQQTIALISLSDDSALLPYKGISHLELGEYDEARNIFSSLQSNTNINDQATWYLALTFLKSGDGEACKKELEKLMNGVIPTTDSRKDKARELHQKL